MNKKGWAVLLLAAGILAACGDSNEESSMETMPEQEMAEEEESSGMDMTEEETESTEESTEEEATEEESSEEESESEEMTSDAPAAESGVASDLLGNGESTSFIFNDVGEFNIFCEPHPVMKMTVIVEEGAEMSGEVAVDIADYEFVEPTITVAPGTVITWTNQDNVRHNVAFK